MASSNSTLLIVDDSRSSRALLQRFFEGKGFEVLTAAGGAEALGLIEREKVDLVLLDVVMPEMDGLAVLERIRETHPKLELPVLMATARSDSSDVVRALELGANDYVTKPIDMAVALARIESQLSVKELLASQSAKRALLQPDGSVAIGTLLDGRYELQEILGAGGFAVVYKARQVSTGQTVAVKLLRAHRAATPGTADVELARFRREMALIGGIQHAHIVRLIDSGWLEVRSNPARVGAPPPRPVGNGPATAATAALRPPAIVPEGATAETVSRVLSSRPAPPAGDVDTRIPFIVMEYLEGETLYALLRRDGRIGAERAVDLLLPIMSALWSAHAEGAVHRDLKPGNIFLARGREEPIRPTILDFGVAKLAEEDGSELTQTESMIGTPGYWSPEQAKGIQDIDERSDQYTLGAILYQCVSGTKAFEGGGMRLVHRIAAGDFRPPSDHVDDLPDGFEAIVLRAMANEPADRFPSVRAMARALLPYASARARGRWAPSFEPGGTIRPPA